VADRSQFVSTACGLALFGAPLSLFAGTLIHPGLSASAHRQLDLIAAAPTRWYLTHLSGFVAVILFVPAVLGLVRLARDAHPRAAYAGGALALLGLIGFAGIVTLYGFVGWQMARSPDLAPMADLLDRMNHSPQTLAPLRLASLGMIPGLCILGITLLRSGQAPAWAPVVFVLGVGGFGLSSMTSHARPLIPATALMIVGLGRVGWELGAR
jgi:hypothetical protein